MEKAAFISVVQSVNMATAEEIDAILDRPVRESEFDSLDFEILRTALEKRLGHGIDEDAWQAASTLRALMESI